MSYSLVRIGSYEEMKSRLSRNGKPSTPQLLLAASFAGALGGIAGNPADILLVRMTSDPIKPPEKRYNYSNAISGLISLIKEEGFKGLARGVGTNTARAVLMTLPTPLSPKKASQVGSYDFFKFSLLNKHIPIIDYQLRDSLLLHSIASCLAGTLATTVCSPVDVLRSRVMSSSSDYTALQILKRSLQKEGPRFLFKGWTPAFIRLGPNTVLLFVFFEGNAKKSEVKKQSSAAVSESSELPAELNFFKYAQGGAPGKRKADGNSKGSPGKRRKIEKEDEDEEDSDDEDETQSNAPENPIPKHRVTAKGKNVPEYAETFEDLRDRYHISSHIMANLSKNGYHHPTGIQQYGAPILLESRDLAAISPTGTGKTLSYLLPIMSLLKQPAGSHQNETDIGSGVRALILAPTKELAHQIHNECLKLAQGRKWKLVLFSKATANSLSDKNVREKVDVIISTPLRLVASLQSGNLSLHNVRHLILDEADRMLDSEFLPQIQEIVAACTHPGLQKAVFSATLPANAEKLTMDLLNDPIRVVVGLKDTPLPLIAQSLTYVADDPSKLPSLLTYFSQPYNPPVLIFTSTQPRATSLAEELILNGIPNVDCLHAGMTAKEREDAISRMRKGESWVMVSTEVMARGLDFKGVREVINYDFPTSVQSYIHRIGRTGRAGREGKAVTFFTDEDAPFLKSIANVLLQSGSSVPDWILKLPKPSKMKRREMGKIARSEMVNPARKIGKKDALKKKEMIAGSKRRKTKEKGQTTGGETAS
ncbi:RNA-dependent ATPase rok1 [Paramarasmius palmivorus]|uniref:RNA helicase n=1 Tax=Paramarasmius palmivorus TaxID=297713 RepID=A0AAW0BST5_9AGAR